MAAARHRPRARTGSTRRCSRPRLILIVGFLAVIFDTTIVSVALHTLATQLHASVSTIQWVTTGYLLALGIAVPLSTWGLRRFGGKRLWMAALAVFLVGSIGSSLAWNVGLADRLARRAGRRRRHHVPAADHPDHAGRRGQGARPDRHHRRPARAARPDPRPARRRRDPDPPQLAVHVLGERAVLRRRPHPRRAVHAGGQATGPGATAAPGPAGPRPARPRHRGDHPRAEQRGQQPPASRTPMSSSRWRSASRSPPPSPPTRCAWRRPEHGQPLVDVSLLARRPVASASAVLFFSGFSLYGAMLLLPLYYQEVRGASAADRRASCSSRRASGPCSPAAWPAGSPTRSAAARSPSPASSSSPPPPFPSPSPGRTPTRGCSRSGWSSAASASARSPSP